MKIGIHQHMEQNLTQELQLHLSPRMLQMLKVLNLNYAELVDRINKESEENVALEVERKDSLLEYVRYLTQGRMTGAERNFEELDEMQISAPKISLTEHLYNQLRLEALPKKQAAIGEALIGAIDERGLLANYQALKEDICKTLDVSRPTVDKVLKIIQSFEPDGVAARSLKECLLIQVREYQFENEALQNVITLAVKDHLDDLAAQKFDMVAEKMGIPREGVMQIAQFIKMNLNPNPGAAFQKDSAPVIPSFEVTEESGKFKIVNLEKKFGPMLRLSPEYIRMLENPATDQHTRQFLQEKMDRAKSLMEDVVRRYETMDKILSIVADTQQIFFQRGSHWLKPLLQRELAEQVGVHASTISRAVAQKFLQTRTGTFPVKFLCPRRSKGASPPRIEGLIQQIIDREGGNIRLSDQQIMELLHREGVTIKRRTVAAYRKKLQIPSSFQRVREEVNA